MILVRLVDQANSLSNSTHQIVNSITSVSNGLQAKNRADAINIRNDELKSVAQDINKVMDLLINYEKTGCKNSDLASTFTSSTLK